MIPIDLTVPMQKLKPENRLLIMWRLGLPCLTSPSPAYTRVSNIAGVKAVCDSPDAWLENFSNLLSNPTFAYEEVLRGQNYLRENHNRELLLDKWDQAIESVIGQTMENYDFTYNTIDSLSEGVGSSQITLLISLLSKAGLKIKLITYEKSNQNSELADYFKLIGVPWIARPFGASGFTEDEQVEQSPIPNSKHKFDPCAQ